MLVYPQLSTGALAQFPVQRRHQFRTIVNTAADGSMVKLADSGAETIEWQLHYTALSDAELANLTKFFTVAEGSLNGFTFLDPMGNLLAWSDQLSNAVWDLEPFLTASGSEPDPIGGNQAWKLVNAGAGAQSLSQTVMTPGGYTFTLSVYAKCFVPTTVTLLIGEDRFPRQIGPNWGRLVCTATTDTQASSTLFGIETGPAAVVEVFGLQVEPQASPSVYKVSTTGGCYENARLRDDSLSITTTGVNSHSATVNIIYASHI